MVLEISLSSSNFNQFAYNVIKSFKGSEWNPSSKEWLLKINFYQEFKDKISQYKIVKVLSPEERVKRIFVIEDHSEFLLIQNNITVDDFLINMIKKFNGYFCKFKNGWIIKKKRKNEEHFLERIAEMMHNYQVKYIGKNLLAI